MIDPTPALWRLRGDGAGPSAYLQAGLHADEIPGMLVLHTLLSRLRDDQASGRLRGDVTVVPRCNPIGGVQFEHGRLLGRFDRATDHNFNRDFPNAAAKTAAKTGTKAGAVFAWQAALLELSRDAALVIDLHTDDEALPYLYVHRALWPAAADLAACLRSEVAILWDGGGGGAFEDAVVQRWLDAGSVAGRLCATVELRGQADVDDALAAADAEGLHRLLRARGVVAGDADVPPWRGETVAAEHVEAVRAPCDGVVVFTAALGERLADGAAFARLVPRPGDPAADLMLRAPQAGRLFTRMRDRYVEAGGIVAKLTGQRRSAGWADQPLDD